MLGIKPGPHKRSQKLPLRDWNKIPNITKPSEKVVTQTSILCVPKDLDIRVCNICYYYVNSKKLIEDIKMVKFNIEFLLNYYFFLFSDPTSPNSSCILL